MKRSFACTLLVSAALCLGSAASARAENPVAPKVIIVAGWENGADTGDAPGEYQNWVEREHLTESVPVRGVKEPVLRRNAQGVYGLVLRSGSSELMALALDPAFDLKKTYWIFTGISGVNPNVASVGSVAWARWVVDGDALRELDDRAIPKDWPYGLYAIGAERPNTLPQDANHYGSVTDVAQLTKAYPLDQGLARWAYDLSRGVKLADDPEITRRRKVWPATLPASKPPVVMMGETLGALRYWHGEARNNWAQDWVKLWTKGQGVFVMTNEESQTNQREMRLLSAWGYVAPDRIMVLRSGSNPSMPPPGVPLTQSMGDEGPGQNVAFDNNERAGAPVVAELIRHWDRYQDHVPSAP